MTQRQVSINAAQSLIESVQVELQIEPYWLPECCIYRVPDTLRQQNEAAYEPKIISIGPFHNAMCKLAERLEPMDNYKVQYLNALLHRMPELNLYDFVNALKELEPRARHCYAGRISLTSEEFVKIMLLDACFIIEYFLRTWKPELIVDNEPLFKMLHLQTALHHDLLLLENQLPLFVFEELFSLIRAKAPDRADLPPHHVSFLDLALGNFSDNDKDKPPILTGRNAQYVPKHFLDLELQKYIPSPPLLQDKSPDQNIGKLKLIPSVTQLSQAGIEFKVADKKKRLLDINFSAKDGVLEIPLIEIVDSTEPLLRNLIAFEQCQGNTSYVSDYMTLMDDLIDNPKDVEILRDKDIVANWLGDDEEVSSMLNKITKHVVTDEDFYYAKLYDQLNKYYKSPWNSWNATLKRDYFNSPWSAIAFVAAAIGVLCTIVQTATSFK